MCITSPFYLFLTSTMESIEKSLKEFRKIPGVGKAVAMDLYNMGYRAITDLEGQDPELMYVRHNDQRGQVQDICMLYTFRCAVYFAETRGDVQDPYKLKWWNWMDGKKIDSIRKDREIRIAKNLPLAGKNNTLHASLQSKS